MQAEKATTVFEAYATNEYVPFNLRIQAAQLGAAGHTIDVISTNYNVISEEIRDAMQNFLASANQVNRTIKDGLFLVATSCIQQEVFEDFRQQASSSDNHVVDHMHELSLLEEQQQSYQEKATKGLANIERQTRQFRDACLNMKRLVAALEVTRIMGKVETAHLARPEAGLNELIEDLETFQTTLGECLREIEELNRDVQSNVDQLLKSYG
jgi:hypothetical protein